jgi:prophage antirepressor-like protein
VNIVSHQFERNGHPLRIQQIDGEPWFVGRDVCAALGIGDARCSLNTLDEDDRDIIPVTDSLGRAQPSIVINESGFYTLVLRSRKPEAKPFRRWVTSEVLPAIRKTGSYSQPGRDDRNSVPVISEPELIALMQEHIRLLREKISPPRQRGPVLSEDEQDEIRNLHAKGLGAAEIGRRINRPAGTVSSWLRRQRGGA